MEKIKLKYWNSALKIFYTVAVIVLSFSSNSYADNTSIPTTPSSFIIDDEKAHEIVLNGTPDDVKKLILSGYDVNKVYLCNTLLNSAIKSLVQTQVGIEYPENVLEKIKVLVNAGADVNKAGCPGKVFLPLSWAVTLPLQLQQNENELYKTINQKIKVGTEYCDWDGLISKPCKEITPDEQKKIKDFFHESYKEAYVMTMPYIMDIVRFLLDKGANVNGKDIQNQTSLHHAVVIPQDITVDPTNYLIANGADVNAKDIYGQTPLFYAYGSDNDKVVNLLINSGADNTIRNNVGAKYNQVKTYIKTDAMNEDGSVTEQYRFMDK